jgi:hypothetical protein
VKGKEALLRVYQVLRPGQEPKVFGADEFKDASEEKHHFEPVPAPPKVAGYAPVDPSGKVAERPEADTPNLEAPARPPFATQPSHRGATNREVESC